jgi:hypothetical protein
MTTYALSEEDIEELEVVCEMMNTLSLDIDWGDKKHRYILDTFSKRLGDVIDRVGEKTFTRRDYVVLKKGPRVDRWAKELARMEDV